MMRIVLKKGLLDICRIVHTKSGLFFNGFDEFHGSSKGKNTLSKTSFQRVNYLNKEDNIILEEVFEGNIFVKNDKKHVRNVIVYAGSEIHKILAVYYTEYEYLPIEDFKIERISNI
uniref:hypothetical protein n=1 Tax=Flavobacterium sp. TaxID=239 RepID=UPI0015EF443A|nr:hypothetical protein [Flavobacterium sp.]